MRCSPRVDHPPGVSRPPVAADSLLTPLPQRSAVPVCARAAPAEPIRETETSFARVLAGHARSVGSVAFIPDFATITIGIGGHRVANRCVPAQAF